jgi:hypothetical protein
MANAYELRKEVLSMAKELCTDSFNYKAELFNDSASRIEGIIQNPESAPPFPSTDEILNTAEILYKFVEQK